VNPSAEQQLKLPIAVIGAGIVGIATAINLVSQGRSVLLIDRHAPGSDHSASYGNGGIMVSSGVVPVTVPGLLTKVPRMLLSSTEPLFVKWSYLPRMVPWLLRYLSHATSARVHRIAAALAPLVANSPAEHQALAKGGTASKWLKPGHYAFVYPDRASFEADHFAWQVRREQGIEWDELEGKVLHQWQPGLCAESAGFAARLDNHGVITSPGDYIADLARDFTRSGGKIIKADVTGFCQQEHRITGVRVNGETIPCSAVVLATGAWSKGLAKQLGLNVPLETERGYHLDLIEPSVMPVAPLMVPAGKFVISPMEGRLRLAGIVEFAGLEAPANPAAIDLLRLNINKLMPSLTWREERTWLGHRPAITDSIPVIGKSPTLEGAYVGFGHHHIGMASGPKTGRLLAELICGTISENDLQPYTPQRFIGNHL
jgi:D-amino-acid dehydrogenase